MNSDAVLITLLVVVWAAFTIAMWRRVSVIPIVPFVPAVLLGIGLLLNYWMDWLGTISVAALHLVAGALVMGRKAKPPQDQGR